MAKFSGNVSARKSKKDKKKWDGSKLSKNNTRILPEPKDTIVQIKMNNLNKWTAWQKRKQGTLPWQVRKRKMESPNSI